MNFVERDFEEALRKVLSIEFLSAAGGLWSYRSGGPGAFVVIV